MDTSQLKAIAFFDQGDYESALTMFERLNAAGGGSEDLSINIACCYASSGDPAKAWSIFERIDSNSADLLYNKSACAYLLGDYSEAIIQIDKLLSKLDLSIFGSSALNQMGEEQDYLNQASLIETLNLKAAILFKMEDDNTFEALQCLNTIPVEDEAKYDSVTLHNHAIYEICSDFESSLDKLNYLSDLYRKKTPGLNVPMQTFWNLVLMLLHSGDFNKVKQILASNEVEIKKVASPELIDYVKLYCQHEEDEQGLCHSLEKLLDKTITDKAIESDTKTILIGIILAKLARVLWDMQQYSSVVNLLTKVEPFLGRIMLWKQNMAHALFMLDTRFGDSLELYEELLPDSKEESLLNVDPMVLSNLCVSYVMTGRNGDAERLIKAIEIEDLKLSKEGSFTMRKFEEDSSLLRKPTTICITNLVIGTLYLVKSNYDFGLSRLFKGIDPPERNLCSRTWFHVKRCLLALLDSHCKQITYIKDGLFDQIVSFLMECEKHGSNICADPLSFHCRASSPIQSIATQAKYLRSIFLEVIHE